MRDNEPLGDDESGEAAVAASKPDERKEGGSIFTFKPQNSSEMETSCTRGRIRALPFLRRSLLPLDPA